MVTGEDLNGAGIFSWENGKMIKKNQNLPQQKSENPNYTLLVSQGVLVGIVTGLIGAGGGFLIVPALVMLLGLDMKKAIGTSLFIIAINSLLGFLSTMKMAHSDWYFLLIFTSLSIFGILLGTTFSKKNRWEKIETGIWLVYFDDGHFYHHQRSFLSEHSCRICRCS